MGLPGWSRGKVVVAAVAVVAVLAGDAVALGVREGDAEVDAGTVLARTTAFVRRNRTAHFVGRVRLEERSGRRRDVGSFSVTRLALEGDARFPGRAHFTVNYGGSHAEIIVLGRKVWSREADSRGDLNDQRWARDDAGSHDRRSGVVRPGDDGNDADPGQPQDLLRLLELARSPRLGDAPAGGRTTLVVDLDPEKAFGEAGEDVDEATMEITVDGDDGHPRRSVLRVLGQEVDLTVEYELSSWGESVSIEAPAKAEVDATPGIEEEAIGGFDEAPLLQPVAIPAGWVLDLAEVVEGEEDDCDRVYVDYVDPVSEDSGYLSLYQMAPDCGTDGEDDDEPEDGSLPFVAGPYRGTFVVDDGEVSAEMVAGDTLIRVFTDLSPEDLATVMSRLRPLDLGVTPEPLAGIGRARAGA